MRMRIFVMFISILIFAGLIIGCGSVPQEKVDEAKHKANICIILAIVLVTLGIVAGGVLCVSASSVGLFGIVLICLGIGCTGPADRYEHKARKLKKQLRR